MIRTVLHLILDLHGCSEHALGRNLTEAIHPDALAASHPSRAVVQRGELNIRFDQQFSMPRRLDCNPKPQRISVEVKVSDHRYVLSSVLRFF